MSFSNKKATFSAEGVRDYEKRRYRGLDQRIVHAREVKILGKIFKAMELTGLRAGAALDMPCGYGRFSRFLLDRGLRVVACDLSFHMVKRALEGMKKQEQPAAPVLGVVADAKQGLPFLNNAFAVVFSIRFFHHVHDPRDRENILAEFFRVSAGWAVVSFYRMNGLHLVQRRLRRWLKKSRTRIRMIEPGLFEKEAEAAGFSVLKVYPLLRGIHAQHIALLQKP